LDAGPKASMTETVNAISQYGPQIVPVAASELA
jgi:hypothetical protein